MIFDELLERLRTMDGFRVLDGSVSKTALEFIRSEFEASDNLYDRHRAICAQIGAAEDHEWRRLLIQLRDDFEAQTLLEQVAEIERMFTLSADDGWKAWLTALAEAVSRFRLPHATALCKRAFPFDASHQLEAKEIHRAVECMRQARWEEVYDEVAFLSKQDALPDPVRARLIGIRGQIDFYRFDNSSRAKLFFEEAATIAPGSGWVLAALADYWRSKGDAEKAAGLYQHAIELSPRDANGYVGMGKLCEKNGHFEEAEAWYRKAVALAGGESDGYSKLLGLIGRNVATLLARQDEFRALLERANEVDPEGKYDRYLSAGGYYLAAGRVSDARKWYQKAIRLEQAWPLAYAELADLSRKQGSLDEAETFSKKAIEVAPDYSSGYVALGSLYEEQSRWADALKVYEAFPQRPRQWSSYARAQMGKMHARLGNYEEAERVLRFALREELKAAATPTHAEHAFEEMAQDAYKKRSDRARARRIYDELLKVIGHRYEDRYHNLIGNLHFFFEDYQSAIEEYRKAIAAAPEDAQLHRNLGTAYSSLGDYGRAEEELNLAYRIDNDEKLFKEVKATLANTRANRLYENGSYGDAVRHYTSAIDLVPNETVYHTNLAAALERLKDPGKRVANLEQAASCYERAQQISKTKDYTKQISRLRRRAGFARTYGERWLEYLNVVTPLAVEVARDLIGHVEGPAEGSLSDECVASTKAMRQHILDQLGVQVPGVRFRANETDLPDGTYVIMINEIPLVSGNLSLKRRFWSGSAELLTHLGVTGEPEVDPVTGDDGFWIEERDWTRLDSQKPELWSITDYMLRHVEAVVRKNVGEFLGHQEIVSLLERDSSTLLDEIRASSEMVTSLTAVCKALLAEEVPIRPFEELCATFKSCRESNIGLRETVERIRGVAAIRAQLPGNEAGLSLLRLSPHFEAEIRQSLYPDAGYFMLAMEPDRCQQALTAIRTHVRNGRPHALVVEDAILRPFVRKLVELEFPDLHVLSRLELLDDASLTPANVIDLDGEPVVGTMEFSSGTLWRGERAADSAKDLRVATSALTDIRIEVFISKDFDAQPSAADDKSISEMFSLMQDGLFYELGVMFPEVQLTTESNLPSGCFRFRLNGVEHAPVSGLGPDEFLVNDTADRLALLQIEAHNKVNPANGSQCAVVTGQAQVDLCKQAGLTTWGPRGYLVLHLSAEIRRAAARFQTEEVTQYNLDSLAEAFPDLVRFALERYSLPKIALLLRELLEEEISIRDLRSILESLLAVNGTTDIDLSRFIVFLAYTDNLCPVPTPRNTNDLTTTQLADFVRTCLKRYLSHKYMRGGNTLVVYLLDSAIENRIADIDARPLNEQEEQKLQAAIRGEVENLPPSAVSPVLLTTFEIRRALRKLIEHEFPGLAVLCYQDLSPDINVQPIARISCSFTAV
jgi:type III secretory pathway component EscV/tetratricopeptide (TPR) repeat protein